MSKSLEERYQTSPLFGGNAPFVEAYYEQYLKNPDSVPSHLREYFDGLGGREPDQVARGPLEAALREQARQPAAAPVEMSTDVLLKQTAVNQLIEAYRLRGHLLADLDPLGLVHGERPHELELSSYGLGEGDMETRFASAGVKGRTVMRLRSIVDHLERIYGGSIGAELAHITSEDERHWLQERFESAVADRAMPGDDPIENFIEAIKPFKLLVTYNGVSFDVPFIEKHFKTEAFKFQIPHIDIMWPARSIGLSGGLKDMEKQLGIARGGDIADMRGSEAITLWGAWKNGDRAAYDKLVTYCKADCTNLKEFCDKVYEKKWAQVYGAYAKDIDLDAAMGEQLSLF